MKIENFWVFKNGQNVTPCYSKVTPFLCGGVTPVFHRGNALFVTPLPLFYLWRDIYSIYSTIGAGNRGIGGIYTGTIGLHIGNRGNGVTRPVLVNFRQINLE